MSDAVALPAGYVRRWYETDAQKEHEEAMREWLQAILQYDCPDLYVVARFPGARLDWIIQYLTDPIARCEFKRRYLGVDDHETWKGHASKWIAAMEWSKETGKPALILVEWDNDVVRWAEWRHAAPCGKWGRDDRDDPLDVQESVAIPIECFRPVDELARWLGYGDDRR